MPIDSVHAHVYMHVMLAWVAPAGVTGKGRKEAVGCGGGALGEGGAPILRCLPDCMIPPCMHRGVPPPPHAYIAHTHTHLHPHIHCHTHARARTHTELVPCGSRGRELGQPDGDIPEHRGLGHQHGVLLGRVGVRAGVGRGGFSLLVALIALYCVGSLVIWIMLPYVGWTCGVLSGVGACIGMGGSGWWRWWGRWVCVCV